MVLRRTTACCCQQHLTTRLPCAQFAIFSLHSGPPQSAWYAVMFCLAASSTLYCSMIDTSGYALRQAKLMQLLFLRWDLVLFGIFSLYSASSALEVLPSLTFSASILKYNSPSQQEKRIRAHQQNGYGIPLQSNPVSHIYLTLSC